MTPRKTSADSPPSGRVPVNLGILSESISFLVYRAHRAMAHAWIARWGEMGMRYGYYNAFVLIGATPGILVVELAQSLGIDKSRVSELIDAMEKDGLVARRRLTSDHRSLGTYLTPEAASRLAEISAQVVEHERSLIDLLFSDAERQTLAELLTRIATLP